MATDDDSQCGMPKWAMYATLAVLGWLAVPGLAIAAIRTRTAISGRFHRDRTMIAADSAMVFLAFVLPVIDFLWFAFGGWVTLLVRPKGRETLTNWSNSLYNPSPTPDQVDPPPPYEP